MQKIFAGLTIVAAMVSGTLAINEADTPPRVTSALPRMGLEAEHPAMFDMTPIITTAEVIVFGVPKPATVKVWTCGAPRALASDDTSTVRVCEWR